MIKTFFADIAGASTSTAPNFIVIPAFKGTYTENGEKKFRRFTTLEIKKFKENPQTIGQELFDKGFGKEIWNDDPHLFLFDIDGKNDPSPEKRLFRDLYEDIQDKSKIYFVKKFGKINLKKDFWEKIVFEKSKSEGGYHAFFRCKDLKNKDFGHFAFDKNNQAFIELKKDRLCTTPIVTQKSPFECKNSSEYGTMEILNEKTIDHISEISKPYVEAFFEVLRSYNEYVEPKKEVKPEQKKVVSTERNEFSESLPPWTDYNNRESTIEKFCEIMGYVHKKNLFYVNDEQIPKKNHFGFWSNTKKRAFFVDSKKENYGGDSGFTIFDAFMLAKNLSKNEAAQRLLKEGYGLKKEKTAEEVLKTTTEPQQKQKLIEVKKTSAFFKVGTLNEKMEQIKNEPRRLKILDSVWYSRGLCFLYGDNGMGKSYLAFQIAVGIARGEKEICGLINELEAQKVLYFDFEQTPYDYRERYPDYKYPENLIHFNPELNKETINATEMSIFEDMSQILVEQKANIIIIDNITALSNGDLTRGDIAKKVMNGLLLLKNTGASILILAHTPKLSTGLDDRPRPITKNQLAGSKKISDLADSMFAIGEVPDDKFKKYIIQTKGRGGEVHGKDNVLLIEQAKVFDGLQGFQKVKCATEKSLLLSDYDKADILEKANFKNSVNDLLTEGLTQTEIAYKLGVSQGKISKTLRK